MTEVNLLANDAVTKDYEPGSTYSQSTFTSLSRYPRFNLAFVKEMMYDARISFGVENIIGPILSKGKFAIDANKPEVAEYVQSTIDFLWGGIGGRQALMSVNYGYACNEVMYEVRNGLIQYKELKPLLALDCRAVKNTKTGNHVGAAVKLNSRSPTTTTQRTLLLGPKCLWTTHRREIHPQYGQSRYYNAYVPWLEKWSDGGFRDCRRLFFFKYAFDGGIMFHPPGNSNTVEDAQTGYAKSVPNRDIAREMVDNMRTGGAVFLPRIPGSSGLPPWEWVPGSAKAPPAGLMEYGKDLDDEIWQGLGFPPEVAAAQGTGAYAGRAVPMDAFMSILHSIFCETITDIVKQLIHPLVVLNFGKNDTWFTVKPYGLLKDNEDVDDLDDANQAQDAPQKKEGTAMSLFLEKNTLDIVRGRKLARYQITAGGNAQYGS